MNPTRGILAPTRSFYRLGLKSRRLLPRQRCPAFGPAYAAGRIERIYVINLDRQPERWAEMRRELDQILDCSGDALTERAVRISAVDARSFTRPPEANDEVGLFYTLGDQLFVEPQLRVQPYRFELNRPIRMSWPEVAVARSHIGVWRRIATGEDAYALVLEDDAWFKRGFGRYVDRAWHELARISHEH
jgi:GR25 family glycosyltransferase involved in LPS biosynthesis